MFFKILMNGHIPSKIKIDFCMKSVFYKFLYINKNPKHSHDTGCAMSPTKHRATQLSRNKVVTIIHLAVDLFKLVYIDHQGL